MDKQQRFPSSLWDCQQSGERRDSSGKGEERRSLNADQCGGPGGGVTVFSHRAQAHLALLDNTTGLLAPQEKQQNSLLLRIQS